MNPSHPYHQIVLQAKEIAEALIINNRDELARIAAALIISHGMQTLSDVGPALSELAGVSQEIATALRQE